MSNTNLMMLLVLTGVQGSCGEGGYLAISAGAPATAAIRGLVTDCGRPVAGTEVSIRVRQDQGQSRPVDSRVGPVATDRTGRYQAQLSPSFAVPGAATVELMVESSDDVLAGGNISFSLAFPPRDTFRLDADVGAGRGSCP